ncbi:MAG TPA: lyase family protein, partial [Burkholderiaceae bacterium]
RASASLAVPLVQALRAQVGAEFAEFVHLGATSQDAIDTAFVLQTSEVLALIDDELLRLVNHLLALADAHAATPLLARTLMQPALVTSLRLKLLEWLQPLLRCIAALRERAGAALHLQLGGAAGTLAVYGERADTVLANMSRELDLPLSDGPWHVQRDALVRLGTELGVLCGCLGKIARDVSLYAQVEVGEMSELEAEGRGASSAMPHKRNPVGALQALAAAQRAPQRVAALLACMVQEQERALGGWQAELAEWSSLLGITHGAARALAEAHLSVHPERMRTNIKHGLGISKGIAAAAAAADARAAPLLAQAHHDLEALQ